MRADMEKAAALADKIALLSSIDRKIRAEFAHIRQVSLSYAERRRDIVEPLRARREEVLQFDLEPGTDPDAGHLLATGRVAAHAGIRNEGRPADRVRLTQRRGRDCQPGQGGERDGDEQRRPEEPHQPEPGQQGDDGQRQPEGPAPQQVEPAAEHEAERRQQGERHAGEQRRDS